jgi:hypothetical protein
MKDRKPGKKGLKNEHFIFTNIVTNFQHSSSIAVYLTAYS